MVRSYVEKVLISVKLNSVSDGFFMISGRCSNSCYFIYQVMTFVYLYLCLLYVTLSN